MIAVRDDDVLIKSSSHENSFSHFKTVHNWICESDKLLHVPAILVTEIQEFPECIEYIKDEASKGKMRPEIHGLRHIDYAKLSVEEVVVHLNKCKDFLLDKFNVNATTWYTPWGANASHLFDAAAECKLKLVDTSRINKLAGRYGMVQLAREGRDLNKFLEGGEIFFHWWEGGMRLKRVIEVLKHGSWEAAKAANGEWFE